MSLSKEWIKTSYLDIESMRYILDVEHLSPVTAFHAQQSIEKSFKAVMIKNNIKIPKQHDLLRLHNLIQNNITIDNYDLLDVLNELYIDSRYPGEMGLLPNGKPTLEDAKEFYEFALDIFNRVCKLLEINPEELKQ